MQDAYTLFYHCLVGSAFTEDLTQFTDLLDAAFTSDDGTDRRLDGCLYSFEVVYFFGEDRQELGGLQSVDAIEEHSTVIVGNQVGVPSAQELLLQVVHHFAAHHWERSLWQEHGLYLPEHSSLGLCTSLLISDRRLRGRLTHSTGYASLHCWRLLLRKRFLHKLSTRETYRPLWLDIRVDGLWLPVLRGIRSMRFISLKTVIPLLLRW